MTTADQYHLGPSWSARSARGLPDWRHLVVTKLDGGPVATRRRDIVDEPTSREVKLNLGGSVHDPTDPVGRLLFNVLAMVAEFESDLVRMRTREGMKVAKARGRLRGKQPKPTLKQEAHLVAPRHTRRRLPEGLVLRSPAKHLFKGGPGRRA